MVAIYRVINTVIYNLSEEYQPGEKSQEITHESIGIIKLPSSHANYQEEVKAAIVMYRNIFTEENVINLLNLLAGKYLKLDSLNLWEEDPENFIEIEDELQYIRESNIEADCSYNFLAYVLCNRILEYFKESSQPWLANHITHIIENQMPHQILLDYANDKLGEAESGEYKMQISVLVEDALLSLIGLLPSIYSYHKIPEESRMKVEVILNYLEARIEHTQSKILKRRYCLLLSLWTEEMDIGLLIDYLAKSCSILFSDDSTDIVVKFISLTTFRDILRSIDQIKKSHKKNSIHNEESAKVLKIIDEKLSIKELFENITPICIKSLNEFESPTQIWKVINLISILIEG